jgi:photosystem II stability/assembly factor-like uncharacterized protein
MQPVTWLRLGLAGALGGVAVVVAVTVVPALDRATASRVTQATATPAPTVLSTAGLSGRAWFVSREVGWVLAEVPTAELLRMELYRTLDSGVTFRRTLEWDGGAAPEAVRFFDARQAFVAARVTPTALRVFTTTDGTHWRGGDSPSPAAGLSFVAAKVGWAAHRQGGSVVVDRTADGGTTWSHVATFAAPSEVDPHSWLEFVDSRTGFMGGLAQGRLAPLYATHDGGVTWAPAAVPAPPEHVGAGASSVLSGATAHAGAGVAIELSVYPHQGYRYAHSYLYESPDGGRSWSQPRALPGDQWQAVDQRHVVAAAGHTLFTSRDGGRTWRQTHASLPLPAPADGAAFEPFQLVAPAFLDDRIGWATLVATQRCEGALHPLTCAEHPVVRWAIARTSDGGSTWRLVDAHA